MSKTDHGVLFDVDGTLVDTTYLHTVCWAESLAQHGHAVPMVEIHHAIGMGSSELLDHLLGDGRDHDADDAVVEGHLERYREHWDALTPLPGARDLLRWCADNGLRVVLASSASEEELSALRTALDSDDAITVATSSSDAGSGKPDPDIVQAALERSELDASRVVFVGDAVWDGAASHRADVAFVAVTCGGTSKAALREAGAIEVWRDPADLLSAVNGSTLGVLAARANAGRVGR